MRTFVVGDIHGHFKALVDALNRADFTPNDRLVVAGDMFDRGHESKEVWAFLQEIPNKVLLWGNHERMLLNTIREGYCSYVDRLNGVDKTINSFIDDPLCIDFKNNGVLAALEVELREQLVWAWEDGTHYVSHSLDASMFNSGDINWEKAVWTDPCEVIGAQWAKVELYDADLPHKTLLFGHWHARQVREVFGEVSKDAVIVLPGANGRSWVALDTCTARSSHLGIVELLPNGGVQVY